MLIVDFVLDLSNFSLTVVSTFINFQNIALGFFWEDQASQNKIF